MQKDFHFYISYMLACRAGADNKEARIVAWANQQTDDCQHPELYGIQTQAGIIDTWMDRQIQMSVIVPFHFMPGEDSWVVTPNNSKALSLVKSASNLFELGTALHTLQDTFSHQGFTGWQESINSCYGWYYLNSGLPNVGHAELGVTPDVTNYTWTDPRTGKHINNYKRALSAAEATFKVLSNVFGVNIEQEWEYIAELLEPIFRHKDYDERKQMIRELSGNTYIRYKTVNEAMQNYIGDFNRAANKHLSHALNMFEDLPREP